MTISQWIKTNLKEENYDYRALAKKIDASQPTIVRWLNGSQFPRPDKFKAIAKLITEEIKYTDLFKSANLHEKLFLLRNFEGLTITEMADGVLVSDTIIRRWEKDLSIPDDNQMRRLMQYFDVSSEEFGLDIREDSFGARLQDERMGIGLTQAELGERIGRTAAAVSEFENEKRVPSQEDIERLAELFGVSIETLIIDNDNLPYDEFSSIYIRLIREGKLTLCK